MLVAPASPIWLHPDLPALYRGKVERLAEALNGPPTASEGGELLRVLIERVALTPTHDGMRAELYGDLAVNPEVKKPQLVQPDGRRRVGAA